MPARVEVFCKVPVSLEASWLRAVLDAADLMTLAEFLEPPPEDEEALVDEMWKIFRINRDTPPLEIHWSNEFRAIQLNIYGDDVRDGTIAETIDAIAERGDGLVWFWHRAFASPDDRGSAVWQRG